MVTRVVGNLARVPGECPCASPKSVKSATKFPQRFRVEKAPLAQSKKRSYAPKYVHFLLSDFGAFAARNH
jgi:hypothetical protein